LAQWALQELIEAEATERIGAARYDQSPTPASAKITPARTSPAARRRAIVDQRKAYVDDEEEGHGDERDGLAVTTRAWRAHRLEQLALDIASDLVKRVELMGIEPTTPCLQSAQGGRGRTSENAWNAWSRGWRCGRWVSGSARCCPLLRARGARGVRCR
jgi:hypothetical protein